VQELQDAVEEKQDEIDASRVQEGRLEALKEGLEKARQEESHLTGALADCMTEKTELEARTEEYESLVMEIRKRKQKLDARISEHEHQVADAEARRAMSLANKNAAFDTNDAFQKKRDRLRIEREAKNGMVEDYSSQAAQVGARVPVDPGETADTLDKKLVKLVEEVERYEERSVRGQL